MNLTLTEVLIHVTAELEIDAADILVFHTPSPILELSAELGFRDKTTMKSRIPMQESYAGAYFGARARPNSRFEGGADHLFPNLSWMKKICCYFGVPLIVKGR